MKNYSLTLVVKSSLNEANRKKLLDTVKDFIKQAKITKEEAWGEKQLAYSIKREINGFYQHFLFELESEFPSDLDKRLSSHEDILRHLILRLEDVKRTESKLKKTKGKAKN